MYWGQEQARVGMAAGGDEGRASLAAVGTWHQQLLLFGLPNFQSLQSDDLGEVIWLVSRLATGICTAAPDSCALAPHVCLPKCLCFMPSAHALPQLLTCACLGRVYHTCLR